MRDYVKAEILASKTGSHPHGHRDVVVVVIVYFSSHRMINCDDLFFLSSKTSVRISDDELDGIRLFVQLLFLSG